MRISYLRISNSRKPESPWEIYSKLQNIQSPWNIEEHEKKELGKRCKWDFELPWFERAPVEKPGV